jgi:hypothetical protein
MSTPAAPAPEVIPQDIPKKTKPKRASWYPPKAGWKIRERRWLCAQRHLHGHTLEDLYEGIGITPARMCQLEHGLAPFRPREISVLSRLYGLPAEIFK